MYPGYRGDPYRNKDDPEQDGQQDTDHQHPPIINRFYTEEGKDENEYEDIVNAQAPFHQVGADVFEGRMVALLHPEEYREGQGQGDPERRLQERPPDRDDGSVAAQQTQIQNDSCQ